MAMARPSMNMPQLQRALNTVRVLWGTLPLFMDGGHDGIYGVGVRGGSEPTGVELLIAAYQVENELDPSSNFIAVIRPVYPDGIDRVTCDALEMAERPPTPMGKYRKVAI